MRLSTFTAREIRNRPGRAILTLLSIVIGVAAVVSVSMAVTTSRQAFHNMYQMVAGKATLIISSAGGGYFDEDVVEKVQGVPGITAAVPSIQSAGNVYFEKKEAGDKEADKKAKADDDHDAPVKTQMQILGIDLKLDKKVRDFDLASGKYFSDDDEGVLLDSNIAQSMKAQLGDPITILASVRGRRREYPLLGTVRPHEGGAVASGGVVFLSLPESQKLFGAKGKINFIHVVTAEHADLDQVEKALLAKLPADLKIDRAGLGSKQAEEAILPTEQGLQLGTALSFVLAVFIILNTFLMNVSERRRQLAILRAIGATRRQIIGLLLREGLIMGVLGTIFGIALGFVGAYFLTRAMEGLFQSKIPALIITPVPFVLGPLFGMGMSMIGTYFPARRAGLLSPLEGMGGTAKEDSQPVHWLTTLIGAVITLLGVLLLASCIFGLLPVTMAVTSSVALMIGMVLLVPSVLGPLSKAVYYLLKPILRIEGRLAHAQLLRRRTRTALTVGVLFIALAMGLGLGNTIVDNTRDIESWYKRTLSCDLVVRATMPSATGDAERMPQEFGAELLKIPGVLKIDPATYLSKVKLNYEKGGKTETTSFTIISREFNLSDQANLNLVNGDQV
ncbi:MAG TPA: FtsX-like permease family protein, partial [Pirellulales bacterium]|nr:FtsX-like permease family protein [Pirellulales bacterium]